MDAFQRGLVDLLPRLRRVARALTRDDGEADALVQAAVERGLRRRGQWRLGMRLDRWMFTVMKQAWTEEGAGAARRARPSPPSEAGEPAAAGDAAAVEIRPRDREVDAAMARLPDDQRLAVALILVEGLSYSDAAEVLEASVAAMASRLAQGRRALMAGVEGLAMSDKVAPRTIPDADLTGYVDGELDPAARAAVDSAAALDPSVAIALARHRMLRGRLAAAYADVLDEPGLEELEFFLRNAPPDLAAPATIVDIAAERAGRTPKRTAPPLPHWAPLAACFLCGVVVAIAFQTGRPGLLRTEGREVLAQGRLAQALDRDLASQGTPRHGLVHVGLSFEARDGAYCRTFATTSGEPLAGLACRDGGGWKVRTAVFAGGRAAPAAPYRTAAAPLPAPVLAAVAEAIDGSPLDAAGEANARARGWRPAGR